MPSDNRTGVPQFVIIGAMKAGTSALFHYLTQHPSVEAPHTKELHYFDLFHRRGWDWYMDQFPALPPGQVTGEASPYYLFHPLAAARAAEDLPTSTRLIVLLRDPVARAWSHYHHMVQTGWERLPFEHAVELERLRLQGEEEKLEADPRYESHNHRKFAYLHRGIYLPQLRRWLDHFPSERLLVATYESFYLDPARGFTAVTDFLDLPRWQPEQFPAVNHGGDYPSMSPSTERVLTEFFELHNRKLERFLGQRLPWRGSQQLAGVG